MVSTKNHHRCLALKLSNFSIFVRTISRWYFKIITITTFLHLLTYKKHAFIKNQNTFVSVTYKNNKVAKSYLKLVYLWFYEYRKHLQQGAQSPNSTSPNSITKWFLNFKAWRSFDLMKFHLQKSSKDCFNWEQVFLSLIKYIIKTFKTYLKI